MNRNNYIYIVFISLIVLTGCEKFLENTPRASISDDKLFESEAGFEQALNGVYSILATQDLYGDNLTMGYLSALAKNYNITVNSHIFFLTKSFNYENSSRVKAIWNRSYNAIATLNNILSHIDNRQSLFSRDKYRLVKGEALALRAYLHFDLYRLFGENYRTNPDALAIPYRNEFSLSVKAPNTAQEVVRMSLADLNQAEELLSIDPITKEDAHRQYRMNYYATLALKARIYGYIGEGSEAKKYANLVVQGKKFPFVKEAAIATSIADQKDRLFSTELVFALRVKDIAKWTEEANGGTTRYFRYSMFNANNNALTTTQANYRDLFEGTLYPDDFRYKYLFEDEKTNVSGGVEKYPSKYWQKSGSGTSSTDRIDQTVPLVRISEMYYILATYESSVDEALGYLNTVRRNRGIKTDLDATKIDAVQLINEITKEYQKEFYAEGQTFFWYKQIGAERIKFYESVVLPSNYIFPIPVDELEYNPNY
ncbi:RagB/SusD family nutrient uptake outer membrane protein [Sphingobacterium faecale]|uniref:RagB/SusD family nutrient uptake outer membrane protein n=1 Tax=Sphingobacterium faecale TaxID=2803775 RepID=A0ABS1R6H7_9SPHI|nr:RagB/SusD family nutrient uptake outer membrane protein [Sphingobacterium faecale]MBL1409466.1 RagB/SusD family nutrient uptake outer membrane protein [Sphingobacterium faecale]